MGEISNFCTILVIKSERNVCLGRNGHKKKTVLLNWILNEAFGLD